MRKIPNIRLDILIKKEDDHYLAHCLQFDIVTTDETIFGVQKAINDLCIAHIQFSTKHDNVEYLFHPAPPEVWAESRYCILGIPDMGMPYTHYIPLQILLD